MRVRLTLEDGEGSDRDVVIDGPATTELSDIAPRIQSVINVASSTDAPQQLYSESGPIAASTRLGELGLHIGARISSAPQPKPHPIPGGALSLEAVSGPAAGMIHSLPCGALTLGRSESNDVILNDPDVSRFHALISVSAGGITIADRGSTNGTTVEGRVVPHTGHPVSEGEFVRLGSSVLTVRRSVEAPAVLRPDGHGRELVHRGPRPSRTCVTELIDMPVPPAGVPQSVQWFAAVLPALLAAIVAWASHNVAFLTFAALGPLMFLGTAFGDRLHWRRQRRQEARAYRAHADAVITRCQQLLSEETAHRRYTHPDAAAVLRCSTLPSARLWERRRCDDGFLDVRLALGDAPSRLSVRHGDRTEAAGTLRHVPAVVRLRDRPLGLVGPANLLAEIGSWLMAQLAVLQSPGDLVLVLIGFDDAHWRSARWLPHVGRHVAWTPQQRDAVLTDLEQLVNNRLAVVGGSETWTGPWIVVMADYGAQPADPRLTRLLTSGARLGVTAISLAADERLLPAIPATVAHLCADPAGLSLSGDGASGVRHAVVDRVSAAWTKRVARAVARFDDPQGHERSIPMAVRLVDLIDVAVLDPQRLADRWKRSPTSAVPVGRSAYGIVHIDLPRDGPHLLVAGTTGSGKSAFLQTLVASWACCEPPELVSFVLIDYKGGAAFAECAELPHAAGVVTDLDQHLTERALRGLEAELRRREQRFALAGCSDLAHYRASAPSEAMPRLVIVIDEFATLVEALPDFVTGLIGLAQRGRSLGIHLVLATQRPSGAVSPDIRANTALRIAFRVADASDSLDVVGSAAAAVIPHDRPGQAILQAAAETVEFQTAQVTGSRLTPDDELRLVVVDEWDAASPPNDLGQTTDATSDLRRLVEIAQQAATHFGRTDPPTLWQSPLPNEVLPSDLTVSTSSCDVPVALVDLPEEQARTTLSIDLASGGMITIIGAPRSGRTSVLRTLALTATVRCDVDHLHVHVIDCAGGALTELRALTQCGAALTHSDYALVERLLQRLTTEAANRRTSFALAHAIPRPAHAVPRQFLHASCGVGVSSGLGVGVGSHGARPHLLLLIDGWESFVAASEQYDGGRTVEMLASLARDAASVGMTVAITGDRSLLTARLAAHASARYVLRLTDRADYALAGIAAKSVPKDMPPGRALSAPDGVELQFARVDKIPDTRRTHGILDAAPRHVPIMIKPLPHTVPAHALSCLPPPALMIGLAGDEAATVGVDLFRADRRFLVVGPHRSGRTTTLHLLLEQALRQDWRVGITTTSNPALAGAARSCGAATIETRDDVTRLVSEPHERKVVLVDDAGAFDETSVGDELCALLRSPDPDLAIVASMDIAVTSLSYRGFSVAARAIRNGLWLQPHPDDGEVLGVRVRHPPVAGAGRGLLVAPEMVAYPPIGDLASTRTRLNAALAPAARGQPDAVGQRNGIPVQVALPVAIRDGSERQPMCGYK